MSNKPHFAIYDRGLAKEHSDIEALCSKVVPRARFAEVWYELDPTSWKELSSGLTYLNSCRDCLEALADLEASQLMPNPCWVYLIVPGDSKAGIRLAQMGDDAA